MVPFIFESPIPPIGVASSNYFHVVFTLSETFNMLRLYEPAMVYKLLFDTAFSVIRNFATLAWILHNVGRSWFYLYTCPFNFSDEWIT